MIIHSQAYTVTSSAVSFCLLHQPHNLYHYVLRTLVLLQHWSDGLSVPLEIVHLFYTISVVQFLLTRCRSSFVTLHIKPFKDFFSPHIFIFSVTSSHSYLSGQNHYQYNVSVNSNLSFRIFLPTFPSQQSVCCYCWRQWSGHLPILSRLPFILWCSCVTIKLKSTKLFPLLCSCNILFQLLPDCFSPYSYYFNLSCVSDSATF